MSWVASKLKEIALGIRRQNKRAVLLATRLAEGSMVSIPLASMVWPRQLRHIVFWPKTSRNVTIPGAALAHCSGERMQARGLVLCIQDTTELDFNG